MSRFHQRLREDLRDPEFAEAFYDMSVDIALLQVLEQARVSPQCQRERTCRAHGSTTNDRDTLVQRCSPKPYSGHHLRYPPRARASGRDQNQPRITRRCAYSY